MPHFTYTALNSSGKTIKGTIDSANEEAAKAHLTKQGFRPLLIKGSERRENPLKNLLGGKVKTRDMVIFTRQLATMIDAGVPLVRALATLQNQTESTVFKTHLQEISRDIEGGTQFADALEKHSAIFSPIYVNMVRAGEAGGILDDILKKLALQQEKDAKIKQKFKSAMTYPTILLTITGVVFIGLMTLVVPRIGKIVSDLANGAALPPLTRGMLAVSQVMTKYWYVIIASIVLGGYFLNRYIKTPAGRRKKDSLMMKIPVLNAVITKVAVARFSRIFASMMGSGVSVIESLNITAKAIGNSILEDELNAASKAVANGSQVSEPLGQSKVFPPIVSQMLAVGEETGKIDEVLVKVAEFYEEEVDATVESLSSILEPIMIVIMGTMVALIAAAVIGPISNLSNQV